jgi:hypothetical protein
MATTISAQDGIAHAVSQDPDVHRPLIAVSPPLRGRDVANLQRATAERLRNRGISPKQVPVPEHGKFTLATALACVEAQYFLGLRSETYLMKDSAGHFVVTEGAQQLIRNPDSRNAEQRARAKERKDHTRQALAMYEKLAVEMGLAGHGGIEKALDFAAKMAAKPVKENPPMSNSDGGDIDEWCMLTGYTGPVPWCGCFVNACIVEGGIPNGKGWIGYTPAIVQHAKNKAGGWSWHGPSEGKRGDLALYDDDGPGGDLACHVEIVNKKLSDTKYSTYGGNTSGGSSGSQSNGGMVARHDNRMTTGGFRIIGFARPPWHKHH